MTDLYDYPLSLWVSIPQIYLPLVLQTRFTQLVCKAGVHRLTIWCPRIGRIDNVELVWTRPGSRIRFVQNLDIAVLHSCQRTRNRCSIFLTHLLHVTSARDGKY